MNTSSASTIYLWAHIPSSSTFICTRLSKNNSADAERIFHNFCSSWCSEKIFGARSYTWSLDHALRTLHCLPFVQKCSLLAGAFLQDAARLKKRQAARPLIVHKGFEPLCAFYCRAPTRCRREIRGGFVLISEVRHSVCSVVTHQLQILHFFFSFGRCQWQPFWYRAWY